MNRERSMTVFMTPHTIEEAGELCHRVAIMNKGRIAAIDTPESLRATLRARRSVEVRFADGAALPESLFDFAGAGEIERSARGARIFGAEAGRIAQDLANRATTHGLRIEYLSTREPSLEEVFIHLTGPAAARTKEADHG